MTQEEIDAVLNEIGFINTQIDLGNTEEERRSIENQYVERMRELLNLIENNNVET